ncbi:hypothetical protein [Lysinibacter cavernae]|uniref:Ribosomally synthesized peptide with SipW-like signal peptide n=1 Tax=Lysinibacter cavernae TaxID=1640652 RepID=A0A7X5R086_9MICO|nr:hypothetical protein [Lysinibacter cavernae]NIH53280.1 hypothetical protein [Lysinibacter cavernae]
MGTTESLSIMAHLRTFRLPLALLALATTAILILSTGNSFATWMVSQQGKGTINTGRLSFQLMDANGQNASPSDPNSSASPSYSFQALTISALSLLPGDTRVALMKATNTGDTPLTLSITGIGNSGSSAAHKDLVDTMRMGIVSSASTTCDPATITSFRAVSSVTATEAVQVVPAASALKPGESTNLCVGYQLSDTTPNSTQGLAIRFTFQVRADQHRP